MNIFFIKGGFLMFSEDGEEMCNCEYCSAIETNELIEEAIEEILNAKSKKEVRDILRDMSEFSKTIGLKEYLFTSAMDNLELLEGLNKVQFRNRRENFHISLESNEIYDDNDFFTNDFWNENE